MQRLRLLNRLLVRTAVLAGLTAGVLAAEGPQAGSGAKPIELGEVRAVFARVDADGDGKLGRREADHGGVAADEFARFDANADGVLDPEEFVVARHALAEAAGKPSAADLNAEATRIQAVWRARRVLERDRGPSAMRKHATDVPAPTREPGREATGTTRREGSDGDAARPKTSPELPYPPEVAGGLPVGLGLGRLRQTSGSPASTRQELTLEQRARAAQELIQQRLRDRETSSSDVVVTTAQGPAARRTGASASRVVIQPRAQASTSGRPAASTPPSGARSSVEQGSARSTASGTSQPAPRPPAVRPAPQPKPSTPSARPAPQVPPTAGPAAGRSRRPSKPDRGGEQR